MYKHYSHLQVNDQTDDRKEEYEERPGKFAAHGAIRVQDFKDGNEIHNQDDKADDTTRVRKHILAEGTHFLSTNRDVE